MPSSAHAEEHIAFHFGALYMLQLVGQIVVERSAEVAALALAMLTAELDEFVKTHSIAVQ